MPNFTSIKGVAGAVAYNAFLGAGQQSERLTLRKFNGNALSRIAQQGGSLSISKKEVVTVVLKINPSEIRYEQPKITTKVQTNSPGRFVVFDWGTDLKTLSISGSTGNMLPSIVQKGYNPIKNIADKIEADTGQSVGERGKAAQTGREGQNVVNDLVLNGLSHYDALKLSPKFRVFERLQQIYETFDADHDVLTMELGDVVYRVYFTHFSFTETANNLWDWKYEFSVNVLSDLTQVLRRGDVTFPVTSSIDTTV